MKRLLLCIVVLTLACSTTLFAADKLFTAHADHIIKGHTANIPGDPVLCSNLGPKTNMYQPNGYYVAGPASALGTSQFIAYPCTPRVNATLTTVSGAWQWYGSGANEIQICLYSDNGSNAPGTQIGKCVTKRNLPAFGTTNTLVTAAFGLQNLSLTAGTQYWIVGQLPLTGKGDDAQDVWCGEGIFAGFNVGQAGWGSFNPDLEPVAVVRGK